MAKFIFSNIVGCFVFSENYKLIEGLLFKDSEQYKEKNIYEDKLIQKHNNLEIPQEKDLYNILLLFKNEKYFEVQCLLPTSQSFHTNQTHHPHQPSRERKRRMRWSEGFARRRTPSVAAADAPRYVRQRLSSLRCQRMEFTDRARWFRSRALGIRVRGGCATRCTRHCLRAQGV